jgi:RHS repeat-associated protein
METNPFRYRGYYWDKELNLYYLQTRYYDPQTGRFINADCLAYAYPNVVNGINLYAYCANNPIMMCDPTGRSFWKKLGKVVGGAL